MRRPRLTLRARLTALYASLFAASTLVVLAVAYGLLGGHLHRTLPDDLADPILDRVAVQLALVLVGTTLLAIALGWIAARRALRPIGRVTATARRVSDERLDERLGLDGPDDEVRELADTFDAMLDRIAAGMQAQRRFVQNASHELRTPLTAIRTEVDVTLSDPDATTAELRAMGERVLAGTDELDDLLEGLLVLARSRRGVDRHEDVDLLRTAREAVAAAPSCPTLKLSVHPRTSSARAWGDGTMLGRVALNLVDNAVRYNEDGGWVRVETAEREQDGRRWATLRVQNSGPRVPPEDVDRIVEPFERLGRHGTGSGLGLSIVRAVVDAHGGSTRIDAPEAGGLDVTVSLPGPAR
ncbi:sensor histidine kinase [Patulibacter minatonensis]|uniref:sensor histidine kinase n=1 Tax=Patulibacter minatonensis TaxID=298163 RepID=UPI0004AE50C3|nr:HAMP domain-containing sensor histidine kinase [Patulibacter minatonensis]